MSTNKLTIENVKRLGQNKKLRKLAAHLIVEKAVLKEISPEIESIYNNVLSSFNFFDKRSGQKITNYDYLYKTDQDTAEYYSQVKKMLNSHGWLKELENKDHCPKLVQKSKIIDLENKLISEVQEAFNFPKVYNPKLRKKLLNLTLCFLLQEGKYA